MQKIFVLDTNVLIHDPNSIFHFQDNHIIIPIKCIEEIDKFKKELNERGRNARAVSRNLDDLRKKGELSQGVALEGGGSLRIDLCLDVLDDFPLRAKGTSVTNDDMILAVAFKEQTKNPDVRVVFLSRDTNLRIKAGAVGLKAENYETDRVDIDELYTGLGEVELSKQDIDDLYKNKSLDWTGKIRLLANQFVLLRSESNPQQTAIAKYDSETNEVKLAGFSGNIWGILPRNLEQRVALDLLLDDSLALVTLVGKAGTGKTLLALAAGLQKVADEARYKRMLVSRPNLPMGKDLGYLPGELGEKLKPWMQPIFDNLEFLVGGPDSDDDYRSRGSYEDLIDQNLLQVEALTYIRGRSIPRQFFIVDEAQNLTPHEIKTIISRAGEKTKIVLTGDPYQIDNPYLDSSSNGLTYVVERFKGSKMFGHITMIKGERSALAQAAADLL